MAHARKEEARAKVEDLLGGGFDYDALRQMAKRAHEELRARARRRGFFDEQRI